MNRSTFIHHYEQIGFFVKTKNDDILIRVRSHLFYKYLISSLMYILGVVVFLIGSKNHLHRSLWGK